MLHPVLQFVGQKQYGAEFVRSARFMSFGVDSRDILLSGGRLSLLFFCRFCRFLVELHGFSKRSVLDPHFV